MGIKRLNFVMRFGYFVNVKLLHCLRCRDVVSIQRDIASVDQDMWILWIWGRGRRVEERYGFALGIEGPVVGVDEFLGS